jgi:hypothetical protein
MTLAHLKTLLFKIEMPLSYGKKQVITKHIKEWKQQRQRDTG